MDSPRSRGTGEARGSLEELGSAPLLLEELLERKALATALLVDPPFHILEAPEKNPHDAFALGEDCSSAEIKAGAAKEGPPYSERSGFHALPVYYLSSESASSAIARAANLGLWAFECTEEEGRNLQKLHKWINEACMAVPVQRANDDEALPVEMDSSHARDTDEEESLDLQTAAAQSKDAPERATAMPSRSSRPKNRTSKSLPFLCGLFGCIRGNE